MLDVLIIGAGVTGCAIARELSRTNRKVMVVERCSDVCEGTSKANSSIVHSGYDAKPGTMKAKMNLRGNALMEQLSKDLDFPYKKNGSLILCFDEADRGKLEELLERGQKNGVEGLRIVEKEELHEMEPAVSDTVVAALYAPTGGIVCPFNLTIALAENAADNGVIFKLNTEIKTIEKKQDGGYVVKGDGFEEEAAIVVNAAGVYADKFHNMVSAEPMKIVARKGEYCLMDKTVGSLVSRTLFQLPTKMGKGILVTPTVHGNLLTGPTADDVEDKESVNTTQEGLDQVLAKAGLSVQNVPSRQIITSFSGLRAHSLSDDFIIGEAADAPGFIDAAGIESPGLTSAPAIGEYVAELIQKISPAEKKSNFIATRKGIPSMALADEETRKKLIAEDETFAHVICRCELVTEGEILSAIHRTLGATTLDGVKRRTRAGMGRCQAGFCSPKTVDILARELHLDESEITKCGGGSRFLVGKDKENV
ncbi:MAG: NAD(P)/FAD-dependent oxidoreductase [Lachnospiraceae bacterium]|nr:NAD(P)/FAD-dependent oxidoreductase [Lachnospiraceae bacterium]